MLPTHLFRCIRPLSVDTRIIVQFRTLNYGTIADNSISAADPPDCTFGCFGQHLAAQATTAQGNGASGGCFR